MPAAPRHNEALTRYTVHMNRYTGAPIRAKIEYNFVIEWQDEVTREPLPRGEASAQRGVPAKCVVISIYPENRLTRRKTSVLDMVPVFHSTAERKNSESRMLPGENLTGELDSPVAPAPAIADEPAGEGAPPEVSNLGLSSAALEIARE